MIQKRRRRAQRSKKVVILVEPTLDHIRLYDRIRLAKKCRFMLKKIYCSTSKGSRNNISEKKRLKPSYQERLSRRYVISHYPLIVIEEKCMGPVEVLKTNKIVEGSMQPSPIIVRNAIVRPPPYVCVPVQPSQVSDTNVKSSHPLSKLHTPNNDIFPSPALFNVFAHGSTEITKYYQEVALEKMEAFIRDILGDSPHEIRQETNKLPKTCIQCKTDYAIYFKQIESKDQYLCNKCITNIRISSCHSWDLAAILKNHQTQNSKIQTETKAKNVLVSHSQTNIRPPVVPIITKPMYMNPVLIKKPSNANDKTSLTPQSGRLYPTPHLVPVSGSIQSTRSRIPIPINVPNTQSQTSRFSVHENKQNPFSLANVRTPIYHNQQMIRTSAPRPIYPVIVPLTAISSINNPAVSQNSTHHYRPLSDIRYHMNSRVNSVNIQRATTITQSPVTTTPILHCLRASLPNTHPRYSNITHFRPR